MTLTTEDLCAISQLIDVKLKPVDERFDSIDAKFDSIDKKFDSIDKRFDSIENRLDSIENRLDSNDRRFDSIENRLTRIEVDLLENNIIPRLNTIESCYMETYNRYRYSTDKMETVADNVELLKKAVAEHSQKLHAWG